MQWDRNKVIFKYLSYSFYGLSLLSLFITIFSYKSPTNIQKSIPIIIFILAVIFKILESFSYKKMKEAVLEMKRDQTTTSKTIINAINSPHSSYVVDKFPHPHVLMELENLQIESTIENTFLTIKAN